MANRIDGKNNYIDTWTSDITIVAKGVPAQIRKIVLFSAAVGDLLYFEDGLGNQAGLIAQQRASGTTSEDFYGQSFNGLQIDVSDCTGIASGDKAWIYLE